MVKTDASRVHFLYAIRWVGVLLIVLWVALFGLRAHRADAATSTTINFQARLMQSSGAIVPDGTYNVEFKLYNALTSSGSSQGSCTGDTNCLWTETRTTTNKITVVNGYLTAELGSVTSLPSIDWSQNLYLTMNIGGTGTASWDGEMSPRLHLTAVPHAFSADKLTATNGGNTSTLSFVAPTASRSILVPDEAGTLCIQSSTNCGFAASAGSTGYIQNQNSTDQTANFRISGTGRANTSLMTPLLQPTADGTTALKIQSTDSLVTAMVVDTYNGQVTIGANTAPQEKLDVVGNLQVRDAVTATKSYRLRTNGGGLDLEGSGADLYLSLWSGAGYTGTQYNQIIFKSNGASMDFARGFNVSSATAKVGLAGNVNPQYSLDVNGDINTSTQYRIGGTVICTSSGCTPAAGSANYIQNGTSLQSSANFNISGTGTAATSFLAPLFDTASAVALNVGTTNATAINLNKSTAITGGISQSGGTISLVGNAASSITTSTGALTLTAAGTSSWTVGGTNQSLTITTSGTGTMILGTTGAGTTTIGSSSATLNLGITNNAHTVHIADGGTSTNQIVTMGSTNTGSTTTIQGGPGSTAINVTTGTNGKINLTAAGTGGIVTTVGSTGFNITSTTNSSYALSVQDSASSYIFSVNTNAGIVTMGTIQATYSGFDGTLNTPLGNMTLGATNNALILAGSSAMTLQATSGSFKTTVGFTAPTANRTVTIGNESGTICLQSSTNCGFAATSGSANYIQNGTTAQSANMYVQAASSGSVAATLRANAAGTGDILDLKNGAGTNVATVGSTGAVLLQNSTNSTTALNVQNAAGTSVLSVDTTNGRVGIGQTAPAVSLDVEGAIQQTGLTTSNTGASDNGKWTLLGTCTIAAQFRQCVASFNLLGGHDGGAADNTQATVTARVKQQNALGGVPYINITLNNTAEMVTKSDIVAVTTQNDATATVVQLYGRITLLFEQWYFTPVMNTDQSPSKFVWSQSAGFSAALPAGTQTATVYGDSYANTLTVQNAANSTTAFQVQNAAGTSNLFIADTTNTRIAIGQATAAYTLDVAGDINTTTAVRVAGTVVCDTTGSTGCTAKSGSGYYIHNQATVQSSNMWVQAASSGSVAAVLQANAAGAGDILDLKNGAGTNVATVGSTGAVLLQNSTNSASAFQIQNAAGTSLFNVNTSTGLATHTGALRLNGGASATDTFTTPLAASVQTAINIPLYNPGAFGQLLAFGLPSTAADTSRAITVFDARSNGVIQPAIALISPNENDIFGLSWNGLNTTASLETGAAAIALRPAGTNVKLWAGTTGVAIGANVSSAGYPLDVTGDVNTSTQYRIAGTVICTSSGCTPAAGSANYIQNGTSQQTSSNFNISGTGVAATALQAPIVDTSSATTLSIGSTNATTVNIASNNVAHTIHIADGGTSTVQTVTMGSTFSTSATTIQGGTGTSAISLTAGSGGNIKLTTASTGSINLTPGASGVFIRPTTDSTAAMQVIANTSGNSVLRVDTTNERVAVGVITDPIGAKLSIATSSTVSLRAYQGGASDSFQLGNATDDFLTVGSTGNFLMKPTTNSASAFRIQNSGGAATLFTVDTSGNNIQLGSSTTDTTAILLTLDSYSTASDPTGIAGAMYYSTSYNSMRCYQDGAWSNCSDPTRLSHGFNVQEDFIGSDDSPDAMVCNGARAVAIQYNWSCWTGGTATTGFADMVGATAANRPGEVQLSTGANAAGNQSFYLMGGGTEGLFIGGGETFETAVYIPTLSNGTQTYVIRTGLCDVNDHATDCTDGAYFEYSSASSANWRYNTAAGGTRTKTSSTKAVATGWTNLKFVATSSTSVTFYVKSAGDTSYTNIGTISSNVPNSTSNTTSLMMLIDKTVGTTARTFNVDYVDYWRDFQGNR